MLRLEWCSEQWVVVSNIGYGHELRVHTLKLVLVFLQFRNYKVLTFWLNKSEGSTLSWIVLKTISHLLIFIIIIHTNTCHLPKFSSMRLNTTIGILLTSYNTYNFKESHNLIVGVCWSVNELVTTIIHLTQKSKHIVNPIDNELP